VGEKVRISQIEGSFYKKDIINNIAGIILNLENPIKNIIYPKEEVYFTTFLNIKDLKRGYPVIFSDVYFINLIFKYSNLTEKFFIIFKKLIKKILLKFSIRKDFDVIQIRLIKQLIENKVPFNLRPFNDPRNIFGIKRVSRTLKSKIRKHISNVIGG
jgi:hypothetical protein